MLLLLLLALHLAASGQVAGQQGNALWWGELFTNSPVADNPTTDTPVALPSNLTFTAAAAGDGFDCLLSTNGSAYCIGK